MCCQFSVSFTLIMLVYLLPFASYNILKIDWKWFQLLDSTSTSHQILTSIARYWFPTSVPLKFCINFSTVTRFWQLSACWKWTKYCSDPRWRIRAHLMSSINSQVSAAICVPLTCQPRFYFCCFQRCLLMAIILGLELQVFPLIFDIFSNHYGWLIEWLLYGAPTHWRH